MTRHKKHGPSAHHIRRYVVSICLCVFLFVFYYNGYSDLIHLNSQGARAVADEVYTSLIRYASSCEA